MGQKVRLFCAIPSTINPPVSVAWIHQSGNGQVEGKNSTGTIIKVAKLEVEFFLEVTGIQSNGTYQCRARNEFGDALSSLMNVIVTCK